MLLNQFSIQLLVQCLAYGKLNKDINKDVQNNTYELLFFFFFAENCVYKNPLCPSWEHTAGLHYLASLAAYDPVFANRKWKDWCVTL